MEFIINSPKYGKHTVLIDDEDRDLVSAHTWCINYQKGNEKMHGVFTKIYRNKKQTTLYIHHLVSGPGLTDHINGNVLDNRKCNLRKCTRAENIRNSPKRKTNTSGYKGVSWHKQHNKWASSIRLNNKDIHLGYYTDIIEAAKAYNEAAQKYHGEFAWINEV
jgi:hypothetical protein